MPDFKVKPDKARFDVQISTIDGIHKEFTQKFSKEHELLPSKQQKLENLKQQLQTLESNKNFTSENMNLKSKIEADISNISKDINRISDNYDELEYMYLTNDILTDYYHGEYQGASKNSIKQDNEFNANKHNLSDIDKLNRIKNKKAKKVPKPRWKKRTGSKACNILSMFVTDNKVLDASGQEIKKKKPEIKRKNRATMLDDFLILVDSDHISERKHRYNPDLSCSDCGASRKVIHGEGICVCEGCGETESIIVDSDCPNYKDSVPEKSGYPYKRIEICAEKYPTARNVGPSCGKMVRDQLILSTNNYLRY